MNKVIQVPTMFWTDHYERCGDYGNATVLKQGSRLTTVQLDQEAWDDLLGDAKHYAHPGQYDREYAGLVASAKATIRRMTNN